VIGRGKLLLDYLRVLFNGIICVFIIGDIIVEV